ncbi:MAG: ketoacyl-ACP synthase III [Epsilonproteobacteria bacterium]|nr:ketoacyl-ACP synthase III [Campylobacterota bacterium]OIO14898.1 MAG: 3-oxoacyl-ACP synthase [Helicobacteraceae bacterium CG1_02_36_14]PIP11528.1 MAG: 3-oxoacyl-ACP synthase [Sulfurimonas sp. CG23_combo_of_CG06-09_8_20_14_all_36_33]PIS25484.1 MAG: 3-oxoacyl-ACP synthase [Sulfurimonas sp. CG08_land_8_20_14_0_20_36_33]PIU35640.1 MAG: 3-oxoacyl-ACP synthase [Sulfurimonas sp. CG07_land_8_20_14_0_80_36_56]PIV05219.1 MAG: 3-oxoacyl-ACP synthase [Sulfurimonas sp. CG03_land_8_20_14_0_80_36_25]PIV3
MAYAAFRSIGAYVPEKILTNDDLAKMVDTTDEWITKRTGIKERRISKKEETTSDMGTAAAKKAIERSGLDISEIDMLICATISPDYFCMPSTATIISNKLGLANVTSFDISAACTGFVYILSIAKAFIESGMKKNVLIVGAEKLSAITDYTDRGTCILFGDGAGAAIISATENKEEAIIDIHTGADGTFSDLLMTPNGGSGSIHDALDQEGAGCFMQMKGNETFKVAVRTLTKDVVEILEDNNIESSAIKHFIPHQANLRIIKAVGDALKMKDEQVVLTVAKYGNTSGASIPMAINDIYEQGKLKKGELMLLDAFGGGLTWGSALVPFSPLK